MAAVLHCCSGSLLAIIGYRWLEVWYMVLILSEWWANFYFISLQVQPWEQHSSSLHNGYWATYGSRRLSRCRNDLSQGLQVDTPMTRRNNIPTGRFSFSTFGCFWEAINFSVPILRFATLERVNLCFPPMWPVHSKSHRTFQNATCQYWHVRMWFLVNWFDLMVLHKIDYLKTIYNDFITFPWKHISHKLFGEHTKYDFTEFWLLW